MIYEIGSPHNYVSLVLEDAIRVNHVTPEVALQLEAIGAQKETICDETVWVIRVSNEQKIGKIMGQLRDMGVLFAGGPAGWPPAEVFDELREKGLVKGEFKEIVWLGPDRWFVRVR